jgi:hypothetical protein
MINHLFIVFFGDLDFLNELNFLENLLSKYRVTKEQLKTALLVIGVVFLTGLLTQIFLNIITLNVFFLEIFSILIIVRFSIVILRMQFRRYTTKIDIVGYFVLNELLLVLKTSRSLKDAVRFIIKGDYYIFSEIFKDALVMCHLGHSLKESLHIQLMKNTSGELRRLFLNILSTWENGSDIGRLSNNLILRRLSEYLTEETNKVDIYGSLLSGFIFLSPPVILIFLLLSGLLDYFIGFILIVLMVIGSLFLHPDNQLSVFSHQSQFKPFTDQKTTEFLIILAEYLINGLSFNHSLNNALNVYLKNFNENYSILKKEEIITYKLGLSDKISQNSALINRVFLPRTVEILFLVEKFSKINSRLAGSKLLTITEELNQINNLFHIGMAKVRGVTFQNKIIQVFSIMSMAFIAGANQIFQVVASSLQMEFMKDFHYSNLDLLLILYGLVLSILPFYNLNSKNADITFFLSPEIFFRFCKLVIFLLIFYFTRNYLLTSFY